MGVIPRSPYVVALLGVAVVLGLAWTGRGRYEAFGPGTPAPSFTASTQSGDTVTLEGYPDRVILLNIWATYRTTGVPESLLIGRDGIIFRRLAGAVDWDTPEWDATMRRLAGEGR